MLATNDRLQVKAADGYMVMITARVVSLMPHHYREEEPRQTGDKKTNHLLI